MVDAIELLKKQKEVNNSLLYESTIIETTVTTPTNDNKLKKRIINTLGSIDIYEDKQSRDCIPDYKFPEIRWNNVNHEDPNSMTDEEIKSKFQLLTNQRNQQKREVCRHCYQTGKRGIAFSIPYFYKGNEEWDCEIPKRGKDAEAGCEGCAWYDFAEWRKNLLEFLQNK